MYYTHKLSSEKSPSTYLSILHDKMDKSKNSTPRLVKKEKDIINVMNLSICFTGMLTYRHKTRGFGHFSLLFLEMGSRFIVTSLDKCLKDIEEPMVDKYGICFIRGEHQTTHCMKFYYSLSLMNFFCSIGNRICKHLR
jgi:hypothetical protein